MTTVTSIKSIIVTTSDGEDIDIISYLPDWAFGDLDQAINDVIEPMLSDETAEE